MFESTYSLKCIKLEEMMPFLLQLFDDGSNVKVKVTGSSMYPFLRGLIDCVVLAPVIKKKPERGDIVLYIREDKKHVLHRVIKIKKEGFYIAGDAQTRIEGPIEEVKIIAVAVGIYRQGKYISTDNLIFTLFSELWMILRPFRHFIINIYKTKISYLVNIRGSL